MIKKSVFFFFLLAVLLKAGVDIDKVNQSLSLSYLYHSGYTLSNLKETCFNFHYPVDWLNRKNDLFETDLLLSYYNSRFFTQSLRVAYFLGDQAMRRYFVSFGLEYVPSNFFFVRSGLIPSFSISYQERFSDYFSFIMQGQCSLTSQADYHQDWLTEFKLGILIDFHKKNPSKKMYTLNFHELMLNKKEIFKSKVQGSADTFVIPLRLELPKIVGVKEPVEMRLFVAKSLVFSSIQSKGSKIEAPINFIFLKEDEHYRIYTARVELPQSYQDLLFNVEVLFLDDDGIKVDGITETSVFLK